MGDVVVLPDGVLSLDKPVELPPVLDLLIVGGGPAGTALAFRARELGVTAFVIDRDDVLTRIRDYAKDKAILPDFGGGDKMRFPDGGPLVSKLHFAPIDKDEMWRTWKAYYCRHNIPAQIGVELTGLDRTPDDLWRATTWNSRTNAYQSFAAKHVALALGGGMPRRLDIPGDATSIATRLSDAAAYLGAPVCVIGGGTSAAEAVIAIARAKAGASDNTLVCWAYQGTKMPAVSKALADDLFAAYTECGNIRYLPGSAAVAVVPRPQGPTLCVEVDRKEMPHRPTEIVQLEFLTRYSIACIGQEIPERFLARLGVFPTTGGPRNKKAMVVTPLLETRRPNLYLIGDLLSPIYLESDDFDADPAGFREIKRRGNVKAALRDGVLVAEVVAQKLAGRTNIRVELPTEIGIEAAPPLPVGKRAAVAPQPSASPQPGTPRLTRLLRGGAEAEEFALKPSGITTIGRERCDICFSGDTLMSERHATISEGPDAYTLVDNRSATGVFLRITETKPTLLPPDAIVSAGAQWLLFAGERERPAFTHYDRHGAKLKRYELSEGTIVLGRDAPDLTLDPRDGTLSRRHVSVTLKGGVISLRDLKSVNGTYLKVNAPRRLEDGDEIRIGGQVLRFTTSRGVTPPAVVEVDTSPGTRPSPVKGAAIAA
jgi:pSer/pThr/pTyr-binding forkhead associated (FHA) protein/thioredoxin reductase